MIEDQLKPPAPGAKKRKGMEQFYSDEGRHREIIQKQLADEEADTEKTAPLLELLVKHDSFITPKEKTHGVNTSPPSKQPRKRIQHVVSP